jgi:hypothetical protein
MQQTLRPYVTSSIALVGAGLIAVTPVAPPLGADAQLHTVELTATSFGDLISNTTDNITNIINNADFGDISKVIGDLFTNPAGVIGALTNLTPDVTTELTSLPASVSVQLPPGLELLIADLGSMAVAFNAINNAVTGDPGGFGGLFNALTDILNAYLNGTDNISLLGGIIDIPGFNGILAPEQNLDVDLNLGKLLDALGLGDLSLSDLGVNLKDLLDDLTSGDLNLGDLLGDLGINDTGLGGVLGPLLDGLGLGSLSLTNILSGLGLDTNVDLNNLSLDSVLSAFGLDPNVDIGLGTLLDNLGFGGLLDTSVGSLLNGLGSGVLDPIVDSLNSVIGGLLNGLVGSIPVLGGILNELLGKVVLTPTDVINALDNVTLGDLLGGQTLNDTLADVLQALGVSDVTPSELTVGGLLDALGFSSSTGDLTLGGLLGDLGLSDPFSNLLDGLNLGGLLDDLGLSDLPLNLSDLVDDLGDLTNLNLNGLLDALGLDNLDLADISVNGFGGLVTELVDTVPQQIIAALGS